MPTVVPAFRTHSRRRVAPAALILLIAVLAAGCTTPQRIPRPPIVVKPEPPPAPRIEQPVYFEAAQRDFLRKRFVQAWAGFRQYLRLYPKGKRATEAHYWLGRCELHGRNYAAARREFETTLQAPPSPFFKWHAELGLAQVDEAMQDFPAALRRYQALLPQAGRELPKEVVYFALGRCRMETGQRKAAEEIFRRLVQECPASPSAKKVRRWFPKLFDAAKPPQGPVVSRAEPRYPVQVGAYRKVATAHAMMARLRKKGFTPHLTSERRPGNGRLYCVRLGPYREESAAREAVRSLRRAGFDSFIVNK